MNGREDFRLSRLNQMEQASSTLLNTITEALDAGLVGPEFAEYIADDLYATFVAQYDAEQMSPFALYETPKKAWDWFYGKVKPGLDAVVEASEPRRIADWLGTAVVNAAKLAGSDETGEGRKQWLSRRDDKVRPFHAEADGQTVRWNEPFIVCGGIGMMFPGDPVGDPECWLNCRCVLAPDSLPGSVTAGAVTLVGEFPTLGEATRYPAVEEVTMSDTEVIERPIEDDVVELPDAQSIPDEPSDSAPVPWHGVLVPEGVYTGDGRKFADGALTWRDLPLPLLWQEKSGMGHEGSIIIGQITNITREDNLLWGEGTFADTDEADKVIGLIADGHLRGVSVDVDQAEMAMEDDESENMLFSKGRVSAATMCSIPAFAEAFIRIGARVIEGEVVEDEAAPLVASPTGPVLEPFVDEPLPFNEEFKRGPGWVTDPVETKRIHDYWTVPGNEGYAKVGWGTPGDFRRLRAYLSKYIGPRFLNRTTAQWHHDALGYWPGECGRPGNPACGAASNTVPADGEVYEMGPAMGLVAAASGLPPLDAGWFRDPTFTEAVPITVTDDGRIFGHLAAWGTCHIGIPGTCVEAPSSASVYAYFRTGAVATNEGEVPVGQITMDTGHAPMNAKARAAAAHYDNTGSVVADVAAGEDVFGIWISGALRDNVPADKVAALRAGALSGDWREIRGHLELVAALVVNVPGFPIPRTGLAASGGVQSALVAAGVVHRSGSESDVEGAVAELVTAVADEVEARSARRTRSSALLDETRALRVAALQREMEF